MPADVRPRWWPKRMLSLDSSVPFLFTDMCRQHQLWVAWALPCWKGVWACSSWVSAGVWVRAARLAGSPSLKGPFGEPNFESRTVSPNCRGTYFVTPFSGRNPAPFMGPVLGQGRSKRRRRCVGALCALCRSLCGGIGRGGRDCSARARWLLCACAAADVGVFGWSCVL